jgi:hypothetical protein
VHGASGAYTFAFVIVPLLGACCLCTFEFEPCVMFTASLPRLCAVTCALCTSQSCCMLPPSLVSLSPAQAKAENGTTGNLVKIKPQKETTDAKQVCLHSLCSVFASRLIRHGAVPMVGA